MGALCAHFILYNLAMRKAVYIDRPICVDCGSPASKNHLRKDGTYSYNKRCWHCMTDRKYRKFKKNHCEECGFVAVHKCQLDVDHIDLNRNNNDPSNLRTLCRNCHSLKTIVNGDHMMSTCEVKREKYVEI